MGRRVIKLDQTSIFLCAFFAYFTYAVIIERSGVGALLGIGLKTIINVVLLGITICCLLCIMLFLQHYSAQSLMLILIVLSVFIISVQVSHSRTVFFGYLFCICALKLDYQRFFKKFFWFHLLLCVLVQRVPFGTLLVFQTQTH